MIETFETVVYNEKFQNHILIVKYDNDYHPVWQICLTNY